MASASTSRQSSVSGSQAVRLFGSVLLCMVQVYVAILEKNKKSSIHVQSISKERINKESACAPPKAAPIQAQSRRILERKIMIKAIRAKDVTEKR